MRHTTKVSRVIACSPRWAAQATAIALLLAAVVMVDIPEQLRYATLPKESQVALIEHFATTTVSKLG